MRKFALFCRPFWQEKTHRNGQKNAKTRKMHKNAPFSTDACNTPVYYTPVSVHPKNELSSELPTKAFICLGNSEGQYLISKMFKPRPCPNKNRAERPDLLQSPETARPGISTKKTEKYPPGRNSGTPRKYPKNTENGHFWYFGGIFSVFSGHFGVNSGSPGFRAGGVFFWYCRWKIRVGPSRGSVAGRGVLNPCPNKRVYYVFRCSSNEWVYEPPEFVQILWLLLQMEPGIASKFGSILGRDRGLVNNCSAAAGRAPHWNGRTNSSYNFSTEIMKLSSEGSKNCK